MKTTKQKKTAHAPKLAVVPNATEDKRVTMAHDALDSIESMALEATQQIHKMIGLLVTRYQESDTIPLDDSDIQEIAGLAAEAAGNARAIRICGERAREGLPADPHESKAVAS